MTTKQFQVIEVETHEPIVGHSGSPLVFECPEKAKCYARTYSDMFPEKKVKITVVADDAWKARETDRFRSGYYTKVPWAEQSWFKGSIGETEHFVHVSKEHPGMVAFIESRAKGVADVATRVRPGTYLKRFYGTNVGGPLNATGIKNWAMEHAVKHEPPPGLKFAVTPDEIERVYINGPDSCMAKLQSSYLSPEHPVRMYGNGDLAVAYIMKPGSKRIAGRCLCWPEKKVYGRRYGDALRLENLLRLAGYTPGNFLGAKLARKVVTKVRGQVPTAEFYITPYLDGNPWLVDNGTDLVIANQFEAGAFCAGNTSGLSNRVGVDPCAECNAPHSPAGFWPDARDRRVCQPCSRRIGYTCAGSQVRYRHASNMVQMANGQMWSRDYLNRHGFRCPVSGRNFANTETTLRCKECDAHYLQGNQWNQNKEYKQLCFNCGEAKNYIKRARR